MPKATKVGVVTSNKMDKSVVVTVERVVRHPLYKRSFKKTSTFMAHDGENHCRVGDRVRISESRPISRRKRWRVVEILSSPAALDETAAGTGGETPGA
ncbi:MAG: 30S ribosomal protein S17 [Acidobacteriota bacterium]